MHEAIRVKLQAEKKQRLCKYLSYGIDTKKTSVLVTVGKCHETLGNIIYCELWPETYTMSDQGPVL